ncbi:hypothetical protein HJFPF1_04684 [Paramyrothecium foliicola]|nr:hypothetical protein HJFPF1_04684 [Paramyrothecium foliicola]
MATLTANHHQGRLHEVDNYTGVACVQEFTYFPRLPLEIRLQIWEAAAQQKTSPGAGKAVCMLSISEGDASGSAVHEPLVIRQAGLPMVPLLKATTEARAVAARYKERPYDPTEDVLYVSSDISHVFVSHLLRDNSKIATWADEVQHVAVDAELAQASAWAWRALRGLPKLKRLSFVFPQSGGETNALASVNLLDKQKAHLILQALDSDAITLSTGSDDDPWGGLYPVPVCANVVDYMGRVREEMERELVNEPDAPPCWDAESGMLRIFIEAAYFVGS